MSTKKVIQLFLFLAITAAAVRLAIIWSGRQDPPPEDKKLQTLPEDAYVTQKKLHAYDLASARELVGRPVWVRMGNRHTYYHFDRQARRAEFARAAGKLGPIEQLDIVDVVANRDAEDGTQRMVAVFERGGRQYAFPIGVGGGQRWEVFADELVFIEDPRKLYSHWPLEVWEAINRHEVRHGMSDLQVQFAIGASEGQIQSGDSHILEYPNGGHPLSVRYRNGRVVEIQPGSATPPAKGEPRPVGA